MSKATINRASHSYFSNHQDAPCPEAVLVDTGRKFINSGKAITHWEVEVNSLEDLARIADGERIIVEFNDDASVADITIYDDYVE